MNIWVNGCFDILHMGHIDLLWFAKLYDTEEDSILPPNKQNNLIVGIDSDERVKRMKGDKRPINDIVSRVRMMENLIMVDDVVIFDTDDQLRNFIKVFNIDYMIVGSQYRDKEVIGVENAKYGVEFYTVDDRSTTNIIKKIKKEGNIEAYEKALKELSSRHECDISARYLYMYFTNKLYDLKK